jgi:two-component system, chemotaxis family, response regulator WspF
MTEIAIAHHSSTSVRAIERMLAKLPSYRVAWTANDGRSALESVELHPPRLLLLDARIQRPSCSEVLRSLTGKCPVLVLVDGSQAATASVYDAMAAGALDVAQCPTLDESGVLAGEAPLLTQLQKMTGELRGGARAPATSSALGPCVVLIGSSTGGPQALQTVFGALPRELDAAYLVAQHVDREFTAGLADWLGRESKLTVRLARADDVPIAGTVLIAGTNDHLVTTRRGRLMYTEQPREAPYRPSADVLFESFASHWERPGVAVLLTGMGRDGAAGMLKLRQAGWYTIAQDAASSVVFGMPKAAIELGAAQEVSPLSGVAQAIVRAVRRMASQPPRARKA